MPAVAGGSTTVIAVAHGWEEILDAVEAVGLSGMLVPPTVDDGELGRLPRLVRGRGADLVAVVTAGRAAEPALRDLPPGEIDAVVLVDPVLSTDLLAGPFREFTAPKLIITSTLEPAIVRSVRRYAIGKTMIRSFPPAPRPQRAFERDAAADAAMFVVRCCGTGPEQANARQREMGQPIRACPEGGEP